MNQTIRSRCTKISVLKLLKKNKSDLRLYDVMVVVKLPKEILQETKEEPKTEEVEPQFEQTEEKEEGIRSSRLF